MEIRQDVYSYPLDYDLLDGPNALKIHIIETDDATIQFGAGHDSTHDEVVEHTLEHDVDVVIVEHGDGDHFKGAPKLKEEAGVEVALPKGDIEPVREWGIEPDHLLEPNEEYWDVLTIDAPGHTPGNMAYLHDDILIAGDTVSGSDLEALAMDDWSGELAIVPPSRNTGGDENAIDSVGTLLEYDFEIVLVSHGSNVLANGKAEVQNVYDDLTGGIDRTEWD